MTAHGRFEALVPQRGGSMKSAALMNAAALVCALVAGALLLTAGARWAVQRPAFEFKRIEVRGVPAGEGGDVAAGELRHVTAASIRAALAGKLRGNYFTMRLDDVRRQLETVPWVAEASVRRVWPDRLRVTLREHHALGAWADGRLLSDAGVLFAANVAEAEVYGPLPEFDGPDDAARDIAQRYPAIAARLEPLALAVDAVEVSDRRSWAVLARADGSTTRLELGRDDTPEAVQRRLGDIVAAWPLMTARLGAVPDRIDARYANGIAASPVRIARREDTQSRAQASPPR